MSVFDRVLDVAKKTVRRVVLPESDDERVLETNARFGSDRINRCF